MFQIFQLFQTYVASVLSGCCIYCSAHTHMLQAYVVNVSSISDVCYNKCFYVANVSSAVVAKGRRQRWPPRARWSPRADGKPSGRNSKRRAQAISIGVVAGVEHEAACMLSFSLCLSLSLFQLDAAGQQQHHVPTAGVRGQAWPVATAHNSSGHDNFPPQAVKSKPNSKGTGEEARTGTAWESWTQGRQ
jgi:hypothetical protein